MSKFFCFTIWGIKTPKWQPELFSYLCYQRERGNLRGRLHYQGFVAFHDEWDIGRARLLFDPYVSLGLGYFRPARDVQSAMRYCKKARTRSAAFVTIGKAPRLSLLPNPRQTDKLQ